jgi:hypothetical protein
MASNIYLVIDHTPAMTWALRLMLIATVVSRQSAAHG